jgi:hypothetical protein
MSSTKMFGAKLSIRFGFELLNSSPTLRQAQGNIT